MAITVKNSPTTEVTGSLITSKKEDRINLSADKRQELFQSITRKGQQENFHLLPLSIVELENLDETYDLQLTIQTMEVLFTRSDIVDVFTIVFPVKNVRGEQTGALEHRYSGTTRVVKTANLFTDYHALDIEQVAESNRWYSRWPDEATSPWFRENLSLSFDYLANHMERDLWGKVQEDAEPYHRTHAQGGPLIFIIMMNRLQSNSLLVVSSLQDRLKLLRLEDYDGEDVSKLVSHVRGILKRLRSLERKDAQGRLINPTIPQDLSKTLMTVFQTSSDDKFNRLFELRELQCIERAMYEGDTAYGPPEEALQTAEKIYQSLSGSKEGWTGAAQKSNQSSFVASDQPKDGCWNCGSKDHTVDKCPKAKNEERIKAAKKAFWDAKKSQGGRGAGRGGRGGGRGSPSGGRGRGRGRGGKSNWKWAPPEKGASNRKMIDGKMHYYHFNDKRWKVCDDQPAGANVAGGTGPSDGSSSGTSSGTSDITGDTDCRLAMANLAKTINSQMTQFAKLME